MNTGIEERLAEVRARMAEAARKAGRKPEDIELGGRDEDASARGAPGSDLGGQTLFGENRVQEALAKMPLVSSRARWHFIGHICRRTRSARRCRSSRCCTASIRWSWPGMCNASRMRMAGAPRVLLEVNVAGEGSKFGFKPVALEAEMETLIAEMPRLEVLGLMAIPPFSPKAEDSRRYFARIARAAGRIAAKAARRPAGVIDGDERRLRSRSRRARRWCASGPPSSASERGRRGSRSPRAKFESTRGSLLDRLPAQADTLAP
jgi:uncharacterized pyridoxal phosphate-containing UPF0001 family protein